MENKIIRLIHRGTGGQKGWIYSTEGTMATLTSSQYKDPPKIVVKKITNNKLIQLGEIGSDQKSRVYSVEGLVQCISSTCYKDPPKVMVTK